MQECLKAGRATLSSELLATATAAAAVHDGIAIVGASDAAGTSQAGPSSLAAQPLSPSAATAAAAARFRDRALTRREETSLMHPLLRLRQACCHPQVGGRLFLKAAGGGGPQTKAPMTMGEVLEVMLTKARVEAEDAQVGGRRGHDAGSMDGVVTRCLRRFGLVAKQLTVGATCCLVRESGS